MWRTSKIRSLIVLVPLAGRGWRWQATSGRERLEVENFPAFIVVDNKGNDFFKEWQSE